MTNEPVIELCQTAAEMAEVVGVFDGVWGAATPVVSVEMLVALAHGGGYVSVARDAASGAAIGASVGFLARHRDPEDPGHRLRPALHSHVTGLLPEARGSGTGRAIKLHQREWAIANELEWIVWTFDPLVRRNAWFNIAVLGVDVCEYLPSFYGEMSDVINAGDDSDRLLVAWALDRPVPTAPRDGSDFAATTILVPTPEDVVALRRTDPANVAVWRRAIRDSLGGALADGRPIVGFTRAGEYVIGSTS